MEKLQKDIEKSLGKPNDEIEELKQKKEDYKKLQNDLKNTADKMKKTEQHVLEIKINNNNYHQKQQI